MYTRERLATEIVRFPFVRRATLFFTRLEIISRNCSLLNKLSNGDGHKRRYIRGCSARGKLARCARAVFVIYFLTRVVIATEFKRDGAGVGAISGGRFSPLRRRRRRNERLPYPLDRGAPSRLARSSLDNSLQPEESRESASDASGSAIESSYSHSRFVRAARRAARVRTLSSITANHLRARARARVSREAR